MHRRGHTRTLVLGWLALLGAAAAAQGGWPKRHPPKPPATCPEPVQLPATERGLLIPPPAALPSSPPPPPHGLPEVAARYRLLRAPEAQCLAVLHASLGNLLARERARLEETRGCCRSPCIQFLLPRQCDDTVYELKRTILYCSELEARNRAAGAALELYYRLAEAEAKADLLDRGAADLADAVRRGEDLLGQGFKLPIDLPALRRQEIDARADRVRLGAGTVELNQRLKGLLGQENLPADEHLWPAGEFDVVFGPLDVDAAVEAALKHRADLRLLRVLARDLDAKTLPLVRDFLKGISVLLGDSAGAATPIGKLCKLIKELLTAHAAEIAARKAQLEQMVAERERTIAEEVRRAAAEWHTKGQLVVIGRERVLAMEARQAEAREKAASGSASVFEVLSANLELYRAQAQLVEDVVGWHAARMRLKLAQGVLVLECCAP